MHRKAILIATLLILESITDSGVQVCEYLRPAASEGLCRSIIQMDNSLFSRQAKGIAFNHELLRSFARNNGIGMTIDYAGKGVTAWQDLLDKKCDILVARTRDSVPSHISTEVRGSTTIKNNYVWIVRSSDKDLLDGINRFLSIMSEDDEFKEMFYRHFRSYKHTTDALSPYDAIIKKYSRDLGIDWRLLASIIYNESRFNQATTSHRNAGGLMQIRKVTADKYGIKDIYNPDDNIRAGSLMLKEIMNHLRKSGNLDEDNLIKFTLASYNAGEARIAQARSLADEEGLDPDNWEDVSGAFSLMQDFSGKQTIKYIDDVLEKWEEYIDLTSSE